MGHLIDRGMFAFVRSEGSMPLIILRLLGFPCVRDAGCRGNQITVFGEYPPEPSKTTHSHFSWFCRMTDCVVREIPCLTVDFSSGGLRCICLIQEICDSQCILT